MATPANLEQIGGDHYKQADGSEEHWDRVFKLRLDYFQGQITKYVERWKLKNGIQDLHKARHFLNKYIELMEEETRKQTEKAKSVISAPKSSEAPKSSPKIETVPFKQEEK